MAENDSHYNDSFGTENGGSSTDITNSTSDSMDNTVENMNGSAGYMNGSAGYMNGSADYMNGSAGYMNGTTDSMNRAADDNYGLTAPTLSFEENPETNNDNTGGRAVIGGAVAFPWFAALPTCPSCGNITPQYYGQVRFLNASTNGITVNISIDGTMYALNSRFATLSNYDWISDGFHTITVQRAGGLRSTLLQQTFPFTAGQKVTMVLTDSAEGGLELIRVIDTGCRNLPSTSGCFRFANMTYSGSTVDLLLSGQTVFRNIRYQSVSSYKQALAGSYLFTAVTASSYTFIRELPIIVIGAIATSMNNRETLLTFNANIRAGRNYTAYLIGNTWSSTNIQVIIAED